MVTASDISLDEAAERALARLGMSYEQQQDSMVYDCKYGHFDCAIRSGGACFNEEIAAAAGIIAAERNAVTEVVVDGISDPEPEDIIALALIGEDEELDDEVMARARAILADFERAGFVIRPAATPSERKATQLAAYLNCQFILRGQRGKEPTQQVESMTDWLTETITRLEQR